MASETLSIMKNISAKRVKKDEYSLFGEQTAMKLRKFPTHEMRAIPQHTIHSLLFDVIYFSYHILNICHFSNMRASCSNASPESPGYSIPFPYTASSHWQYAASSC